MVIILPFLKNRPIRDNLQIWDNALCTKVSLTKRFHCTELSGAFDLPLPLSYLPFQPLLLVPPVFITSVHSVCLSSDFFPSFHLHSHLLTPFFPLLNTSMHAPSRLRYLVSKCVCVSSCYLIFCQCGQPDN